MASACALRDRADGADDGSACRDLGTGRQRRLACDRHDALAGAAAMLHAAHHLLADEAALVEGDAVEKIEVGLVREGIAEGIVLAALRHAECDAVGVVGLGPGIGRRNRCLRENAPAKLGKTRVREIDDAVGGAGSRPPLREHAVGAAGVGDLDLGAQAVQLQPLDQLRHFLFRGFEQESARRFDHEEVEQDLALGCQQAGMDRRLVRQQSHVVGDDALQQLLRVVAGNAHDAAIGQQRDLCRCHRGQRPSLNGGSILVYVGAPQVRVRGRQGKKTSGMADSFDVIVKGATVVNHDGAGVRDIGIRDGKIAAIGSLTGGWRERGDRRRRAARAAGRDRHPGALPRAGHGAQGGPGDGQPRRGHGRRDGRVRDAQHQAADHHAGDAGRQGAARARAHVLRLCLLCRRHARERRGHPGARAARGLGRHQGVHGRVHRRPAGRGRAEPRSDHCQDFAPRGVPFRGRGSAQGARGATPQGRPCLASRVARRGGGADRHPAAGAAGGETRQARACAAHLDRGGDGVPGRAQGVGERGGHAASPHPGGARLLRAARHLRADEPAGARRAASARDLGRARRAASSTCWAPTMRRTRARRRTTPIRRAIPA